MYILPYITPYNYGYSESHDALLKKILRDGRPVEITDFWLTFAVDNKHFSVWRENKWYAYGSTIMEVSKVKGAEDLGFFPAGDIYLAGARPKRSTLVALDRMVKVYEATKEAQKKKKMNASLAAIGIKEAS